ncbi:hypothetical protein KGS77_09430 [Streptomyces sp. MST-110588]|nr:hypothetical protein [Streptomyces sp. MST-110588]UNO43806.1 hypothetical protein KGS77_09430 [Streptomyces sp. MST-110588]
MREHGTRDGDSAARHARFGTLPERIAYEDMTEVKAASPRDPERDAGDPEARHVLTCLAWDLVL